MLPQMTLADKGEAVVDLFMCYASFQQHSWPIYGNKSDNSLRIKYETESQRAAILNQPQLQCEQRCCLIIQEEQT